MGPSILKPEQLVTLCPSEAGDRPGLWNSVYNALEVRALCLWEACHKMWSSSESWEGSHPAELFVEGPSCFKVAVSYVHHIWAIRPLLSSLEAEKCMEQPAVCFHKCQVLHVQN